MKTRLISGAILTALLTATASAQYHKYDEWDKNYTVSGLLGAVQYENLKLKPEDVAPGESAEVDLSLIPQFGGAWTTLPKGDRLQYGLECSFLLGVRFDSVNYASIGGNGLYVSLSTQMWMIDFAGGGYASIFLTDSEKLRLYLGGGPLLTAATYRSERDYSDGTPNLNNTESAFGLGLYARTGFEFRVHAKGMLGLGVRGTWASVDFSEIGGSTDLTGLAVFASYTAGF